MHTRPLSLDTAEWSYAQAPPSPTSAGGPAPLDSSRLYHLGSYRPCTQSPSQIHAELIASGDIPDPFLGLNEELVQWVGETTWVYRCKFELGELPIDGEQTDLVFEGLDTFTTVFFNGRKILESDNMFTPYRVNVTADLRRSNELFLVFESAFRRGRRLEEKYLGRGKHWPAWNGDPSRLFARKAGYHYGWDWGPTLVTAGPWKPIRLETYAARIFDFWPQAVVDADLNPFLRVHYQVADASPLHFVNATLRDPTGTIISKLSCDAIEGRDGVSILTKGDVKLWWPSGMGEQPLYSIQVELVDTRSGTVLDTVKRKVAFRRVEIIQRPLNDELGTSFCFQINNVPFFVGGSNWIPLDSILSNTTEDRYRRWLKLLVEGNQRMVRVWGGGIYEDDKFYDICDELGVLVWQDFAFACGAYPAHPEFLESVKQEAIANVKRLRAHPSLALFAGNNEDYQIAESEKLEYDPNDRQGDWSRTNFPAREIYERLLPSIVREHSDTFYWPGSPFGGASTRDPTVGDIHQWDVWHGSQAPYQDYDKLSGRFVSEVGMEAAPHLRTIEYFLDGEAAEAFQQSRTVDAHNKAGGHARRLASYIAENLRFENSLEGYIYATQFIQAEALSTAFSSWRRLFKGSVKEAYCAGALVWQLNDVWPTTSWSIADYFLRPKPAYFSIKRALAAVALGSKRYTERTYPDPNSAAEFTETTCVEVWASSSLRDGKTEAELVIEGFSLSSGKKMFSETEAVYVLSNRSTELKKFTVPNGGREQPPVVVSAKLVDRSGRILSRTSAWPEPFKYLMFPNEEETDLHVELSVPNGTVSLKASRPVKGLVVCTNDDSRLSDNFIDLVPGQEVTVEIAGASLGTKLSWAHCGTFANRT
ncbi:hypothetical protein JCM11491_002517 [Sporobolomyces phaffii]